MKSNPSTLYKCALCKGNFKFEDLRYSNNGKSIVCTACYGNVMKSGGDKKTEVTLLNGKSTSIKFVCLDCRYNFSLKKDSKIKLVCPYCGGANLKEGAITAEELINESIKIPSFGNF